MASSTQFGVKTINFLNSTKVFLQLHGLNLEIQKKQKSHNLLISDNTLLLYN